MAIRCLGCAHVGATAVFLLSALLSFGIAQVIMLIAKSEHNTRPDEASGQILKLLREIARNTTPKP